MKECPRCSDYWLWSDNFLAQIVLRRSRPAMAATIERRIGSYGVAMHSGWAVLDPRRAEVSFRATTDRELPGADHIRYSDFSGTEELTCAAYANVAFLKAIDKFQRGDRAGALACYNLGKAKWDGTGFHEPWQPKGIYAVYKTALGLLAQKLTGFPAIGIPANYFDRFQGPDGGIRTDITGCQPSGQENVETTAAVVLAKDPALLKR